MREWGRGNEIGGVYIISQSRLGSNDWDPLEGSLALCVEHSGDCFYDYVALIKKGSHLKIGRQFGSYCFSKKSKIRLSKTQFHLLLAKRGIRIAA